MRELEKKLVHWLALDTEQGAMVIGGLWSGVSLPG